MNFVARRVHEVKSPLAARRVRPSRTALTRAMSSRDPCWFVALTHTNTAVRGTPSQEPAGGKRRELWRCGLPSARMRTAALGVMIHAVHSSGWQEGPGAQGVRRQHLRLNDLSGCHLPSEAAKGRVKTEEKEIETRAQDAMMLVRPLRASLCHRATGSETTVSKALPDIVGRRHTGS